MKSLVSRMHGGQKGFTLIELLVVIAILGVIAAVVALNVSTFFGRGTVQAANTELHQVQTAIISVLADAESGTLTGDTWPVEWSGGSGYVGYGGNGTAFEFDAADYVYGPFRATYSINQDGSIEEATTDSPPFPEDRSPWSGIVWDPENKNWMADES